MFSKRFLFILFGFLQGISIPERISEPRGFSSGQDRQKEKLPGTSPGRLRGGILTRGFREHIKDHCFSCSLFRYSFASQYQEDLRAWLDAVFINEHNEEIFGVFCLYVCLNEGEKETLP